MKKPAFKVGDKFTVEGQEYEVVTTSTNEELKFHSYEIKTVKDAEAQRARDEKAVEAARVEAEAIAQEQAELDKRKAAQDENTLPADPAK